MSSKYLLIKYRKKNPSDYFVDRLQVSERQKFFSIFYMSINAGSLLSTLITPILRGERTILCSH